MKGNEMNSMDEVKMASMIDLKKRQKAADMPQIEDKNHPVYWNEEQWIEKWLNENPQVLFQLEGFKDLVIRKYEEESKKVDGWEIVG